MILKKRKWCNASEVDRRACSNNRYKNFFMFIMAMLICGVAINLFYEPNEVVTSGSTGLAILINGYIDIDVSVIVFAISAVLLAVGIGTFGIDYGGKCLLGTILYPIFIRFTSLLGKVIVIESSSLFLVILIGGVLYGIGFGLVKKSGYSLGGFYVLYDILNRYFKVSMGTANMICNIVIIVFSSFTFGTSKCIYAAIALYISSYVADRIMLGISLNKAFYIVTKKPMMVKEYIINNLNKDVTIVNAKGGYTDKKRKLLLCVIPTRDYNNMKNVIKEIDKDAFFLITDTYSMSKRQV